MKVVGNLKRFFYDREAVQKALGKKRLKALRKAGGELRKRARRKLRRRKRKSRPGEAPSVHTASAFATLKNVQFGFDTFREVAVVGAIGFDNAHGDPPAPGVMEHGGEGSRVNERRTLRVVGVVGEIAIDGVREYTTRTGKTRRVKLRKSGRSTRDVVDWKGKTRRVTYARLNSEEQARRANELNAELYGPASFSANTVAPRPFMAPAAQEASAEFLDLYLKEG